MGLSGILAGPIGERSVFDEVVSAFPAYPRSVYTKRTLIALSHGMEDQAIQVARSPLVFATFQIGRFLRPAAQRYAALGARSRLVAVFARGATETLGAKAVNAGVIPVDLSRNDPLCHEWHVVIAAENFMALLLCQALPVSRPNRTAGRGQFTGPMMDLDRSFEGIWTFEPEIVRYAASAFLNRLGAERRGHRDALVVPESDTGAAAMPFVQPLTSRILEKLQTAANDERKRRMEVEEAYGQTVRLLGGAVEAKDHETGEHVSRVMALAEAIGHRLGWRAAEVQNLRFGAALHDIGKIGVPEAVLLKPGPLDPAELALMRQHPLIGARIVAGVPRLEGASLAVRHHHERWDGGGYPDGLAGEEIPPIARVVAIADVFDALRSDRPYRTGWTLPRVLDFLREQRGTAFEPLLVDTLLSMLESDNAMRSLT